MCKNYTSKCKELACISFNIVFGTCIYDCSCIAEFLSCVSVFSQCVPSVNHFLSVSTIVFMHSCMCLPSPVVFHLCVFQYSACKLLATHLQDNGRSCNCAFCILDGGLPFCEYELLNCSMTLCSCSLLYSSSAGASVETLTCESIDLL